jgi:hypothetical protein
MTIALSDAHRYCLLPEVEEGEKGERRKTRRKRKMRKMRWRRRGTLDHQVEVVEGHTTTSLVLQRPSI